MPTSNFNTTFLGFSWEHALQNVVSCPKCRRTINVVLPIGVVRSEWICDYCEGRFVVATESGRIEVEDA